MSQVINVSEELKNLRQNVSEELAFETSKHLGCSFYTVKNYLAGKGKKEKLANRMLEFLTSKVQKNEN